MRTVLKDLLKVDILLQCSDPKHASACVRLRKTLMKKFPNVSRAQAVQAMDDAEDFCVNATATIQSRHMARFKKDLDNLRDGSSKTARVSRSKIMVLE